MDLASVADLRSPVDLTSPSDLAGSVIGVKITARDTCVITTDPPSITVPTGTGFTVNWLNLAISNEAVDINKNGNVPIIMGLQPGTSYHDAVRTWCGTLFSGTFEFLIDGCGGIMTYHMPVNCGG